MINLAKYIMPLAVCGLAACVPDTTDQADFYALSSIAGKILANPAIAVCDKPN